MTIEKEKIKFNRNEILTLTINGAVQHNSTYEEEVKDNSKLRIDFNKYLRSEIEKKGDEFISSRNSYKNDNKFIEFIEDFRSKAEQEYKVILKDGMFKFGTAQKLINLYLKYLWTFKFQEFDGHEPSHCPIDRKIKDELIKRNKNNKILKDWTKIKYKEEYQLYINAIRKIIGDGNSMAEWELNIWNN